MVRSKKFDYKIIFFGTFFVSLKKTSASLIPSILLSDVHLVNSRVELGGKLSDIVQTVQV